MGAIVLGIVFFFLAFLIIGLILLQEGKGGGLAGMGSAAMDGVMGAKNPLRRFTAYLFCAFIVLILAINYQMKGKKVDIDEGVTEVPKKEEAKTPAKTELSKTAEEKKDAAKTDAKDATDAAKKTVEETAKDVKEAAEKTADTAKKAAEDAAKKATDTKK